MIETYNRTTYVSAKKQFYIMLVRPHITYCFPLSMHAGYICSKYQKVGKSPKVCHKTNYTSDYKTRLLELSTLSLMYQLKLTALQYQQPQVSINYLHFNILEYSERVLVWISIGGKLFHNLGSLLNK